MKFAYFIFYLGSALCYAYCLYWTFNFIPIIRTIPGFNSISVKLSYLTTWCTILQTIYNAVGAIDVAFHGRTVRSSSTRRYFGRAFAGPVAYFVVTTFWSIYAYDRELVYPRAWVGIPEWWNQAVHTLPAFTILMDHYICDNQDYDRKRYSGMKSSIAFTLVYMIWALYLGHAKSFWLYPILGVFGLAGRSIFIAGCMLFMFVCFIFNDWLSRTFWYRTLKIN